MFLNLSIYEIDSPSLMARKSPFSAETQSAKVLWLGVVGAVVSGVVGSLSCELLEKTKRDDRGSVTVHVSDVGGGESVGVGVEKTGGVEVVDVGHKLLELEVQRVS